VQVVERWILAALRHQKFFRLADLNNAILGALARRKVDTVFAMHFLFAGSEHRTKGRINEKRPPFQILQRDDCLERIVEELVVGPACGATFSNFIMN